MNEKKIPDLVNAFRALHRLSLAKYSSYSALYSDYLQTGVALFSVKTGIVSHIEDSQYTVLAVFPNNSGIASGDVFALGDTYCALVTKNNATIAVEQAGNDAFLSKHPIYKNYQLETYIAAPIWVNGKIFGTLNFSAPDIRRTAFDEADVELIELMAQGIGRQLENDMLEQARTDALARVRETVELFESAFEYAAIGMALVGVDGRWLRVNGALSDMLGYGPEELMHLDFQTLTHPEDLDADLSYVEEMLEGVRDSYRMEKRYFHKDGKEIYGLLSVSLVRNEDGTPRYFVSQIQNITERKHADAQLELRQQQLLLANRKLQKLSTTDALTGVLNRRGFDERLGQEVNRSVRSAQPFSLLLLDIDYFKKYNDDFGHQAGDGVLNQLGTRMTQIVRFSDLVARYGGEEFAVILPDTDLAGAEVLAEKVRLGITNIGPPGRPITVSIGVASFEPSPTLTRTIAINELIAAADRALYRSKEQGRNRTSLSEPIVS